ncbi:hypothetical protein COS75_00925 [Candidatus Pacearchaeota archaeon CG06_land_8_20_14_3_00_35_12]|nr:MAG: hypothetical protein COS75_00925 [Candidatus Pacearchaeota archaeon CG06_land_8_20_14_3_00_35_12]
MKNINNSNFAYLIGNFMADGSFYKTERGYRFEFVDGSPYDKELRYSLNHILTIKRILENFLGKKLRGIRKRGNRFVLSFREKNLAELFIKYLKLQPGDKSRIIDIPTIYKNSVYEKDFWVGYLDGDGSIARKSRRIAVESMSKGIIESFANYLIKNKILFSKYESKRGKEVSYIILIRSVSFRDFAKKIGFIHPLKARLLDQKLKDKDFFVKNNIKIRGGIIEYNKIFNDTIFVENGRELLVKYGDKKYHRSNVKFNEIILLMRKRGIKTEKILKELNKYRFKKSKGSKNSVRLPLFFDKDMLKIGKFVRIRDGGISFSKNYINSFNENFSEILRIVENVFDIKPIYTCKNEPIFCSGVLKDFFNTIINRS